LALALSIPQVELINDFAAMGFGLLTLQPSELLTLNAAPHDPMAPIATIGAGTGLGECFLTPREGGAYNCFACEGGHVDFAPINDLEIELLQFLKRKFKADKRVSVERVISGPGLSNIFEFLCARFPEKVDTAVFAEWKAAGDMQGAVVGSHAPSDPLCHQAMEIFVSAYGREAGNAALKYLPRGGFYITGGMAPKNLPYFAESPLFLEAFFDKGRVSVALRAVPVYIVLTEELGERGAHFHAHQLVSRKEKPTTPASCYVSCALWTATVVALLSVVMSRKH
jgi:glucokinase